MNLDGLTVKFWLRVRTWSNNNFQIILRTTSVSGYNSGIYVGDVDNKGVIQFIVRTASGQ